MKNELQAFINELKHNQKINSNANIENRIDIDYVIERLESIILNDDLPF